MLTSWKESYDQLDSIFKSRDITLSTEVHLVKAMVFPVVMYGCESWTVKKDEHRRIDALELWCWRRLLRVPWTARISNQSILKETSPEYSLEGQMAEVKTLILWPPDAKRWLIGKDPDAGKDWKQKERGTAEDEMVRQYHRLNGCNMSKLQEIVKDSEAWPCCSPWSRKESDTTEQLKWTELKRNERSPYLIFP